MFNRPLICRSVALFTIVLIAAACGASEKVAVEYDENTKIRKFSSQPLTLFRIGNQVSSNSVIEMYMRAECVGRGCTPGKITYAFRVARGSVSSDNYVQSRYVVIEADDREFTGEKSSDQDRELYLREGNINFVILNQTQVDNLLASGDIVVSCAGKSKRIRGGLRRQMEEMTRQIMEGRSTPGPATAAQ